MSRDELLKLASYHRSEYIRLSAEAGLGPKNSEPTIRTLIEELQVSNMRFDEMAASAAELEASAMTDHLTGIGNLRYYEAKIAQLLAEAERDRECSLLLLDIDNFKSFNDTFGHAAGNEAIVKVAGAIKSITRKIDCVARYGGEEFVVAGSVSLDGAQVMGEKLRSTIADIRDIHRPITVSIGVAHYRPGDTANDLFVRADTALYYAKHDGRDRVVAATWECNVRPSPA